jgi:hypothetical protein
MSRGERVALPDIPKLLKSLAVHHGRPRIPREICPN